jgi:uncharacterized protein YndB with AHSA1/START domain
MPTDLIHRIGIATLAEKIYRAITTEEGIRTWMHIESPRDFPNWF